MVPVRASVAAFGRLEPSGCRAGQHVSTSAGQLIGNAGSILVNTAVEWSMEGPRGLPWTGHQAAGVGLQDLLGVVTVLEMRPFHSRHLDCIRMRTPLASRGSNSCDSLAPPTNSTANGPGGATSSSSVATGESRQAPSRTEAPVSSG